jgi:acyl-coenzyme A synthetase/AMP-(fatty) acid ligase
VPPDALANRINDCGAEVVITAKTAPRGDRRTNLKSDADAALLHCLGKVRCTEMNRLLDGSCKVGEPGEGFFWWSLQTWPR